MLTSSTTKSPAILSTKARLLLPVYQEAAKVDQLDAAILAHGIDSFLDYNGRPRSTLTQASLEAAPVARHAFHHPAIFYKECQGSSYWHLHGGVIPWQWAMGLTKECRTA